MHSAITQIVATANKCSASSTCLELVKGFPAAFVALVIGLIAAGIALQQYRVARAKLKLDLFEKRYAIFLETWKILSEAALHEPAPIGLSTPFSNFIPQAAFLFGPDIETYLNAAATKWTQLCGLREQGDPAARATLEQWFFQQANCGAKEQFMKYLSFHDWS